MKSRQNLVGTNFCIILRKSASVFTKKKQPRQPNRPGQFLKQKSMSQPSQPSQPGQPSHQSYPSQPSQPSQPRQPGQPAWLRRVNQIYPVKPIKPVVLLNQGFLCICDAIVFLDYIKIKHETKDPVQRKGNDNGSRNSHSLYDNDDMSNIQRLLFSGWWRWNRHQRMDLQKAERL